MKSRQTSTQRTTRDARMGETMGAQPTRQRSRGLLAVLITLAALTSQTGCPALTNPVNEGIPATRVPPEYLGRPREEEKTIPLTWLVQKPPAVYQLDAGDVLGIYIEGVLGTREQVPPVNFNTQGTRLPPAFGFPIPVSADGTLPLPLVPPVQVKGLSLPEAQQKIVREYEKPRLADWFRPPVPILEPGRARVVVTLYRQRQIHVQVVRQDGGTVSIGNAGAVGSNKRGTGSTIDLPAYENDILNALNRTGGLPGLDALNEVIIERAGTSVNEPPQVARIPLRMRPGETAPFKAEDILLHEGDTVFIEARDTELFYAAGLLPPHQYVLPRDYDLRAIEAVSLAQGTIFNGNQSQNNLSGVTQPSGLGTPNPSRLSIIRRTKDYGQLVIIVDLNKAARDTRENILIQPGDVLVLQSTPLEAVTQYLTTVIRFNYLATLINQADLTFTSSASLP